jgi:hypothetical protein
MEISFFAQSNLPYVEIIKPFTGIEAVEQSSGSYDLLLDHQDHGNHPPNVSCSIGWQSYLPLP